MNEFPTLLQVLVGACPAVALYVAIRVDLAILKVRLDRAEQDIKENGKNSPYPQLR